MNSTASTDWLNSDERREFDQLTGQRFSSETRALTEASALANPKSEQFTLNANQATTDQACSHPVDHCRDGLYEAGQHEHLQSVGRGNDVGAPASVCAAATLFTARGDSPEND